MKLTVLGSGSCVAEQNHRASSGYVLEIGDTVILVDSGTGTLYNLSDTDYSVQDIDHVVSTHRHPDHISDLIPLVQDKVVRSFKSKEPEVFLHGPEGHKQYIKDRMQHEMARKPDSVKKDFDFSVTVNELEESQRLGDVLLETKSAEHGPEGFKCLSLRFEYRGESIVFTGDTDYHKELVELASRGDLVVTDCSRPAGEEVEGHMNVEECAQIAEKAGNSVLVLSHLYPEAEEADLESQASEHFEGEVVVAEDLKVLEY